MNLLDMLAWWHVENLELDAWTREFRLHDWEFEVR